MGETLNSNSKARAAGRDPVARAFLFRGSAFCFLLLISLVLTSRAQELEHLSAAVARGNAEQKRDALFQIRNLRSEIASRVAIPALNDSDATVRATAAASVVFLPNAEAVSVLVPLLSDKDAFVRKEAAYALGNVESPDAAVPLIGLLQREKDLEVQAAAAVGLGQTGNPAAVEPLVSILKRRPTEDTEFLRRSAARSIGRIAQFIKTGNAYIVTPQNFLPEEHKTIIREDLTVSHPGFESAIPVLSAVLQDRSESGDTRREAAYSLGAIGNSTAANVLQKYKSSPDPYLSEIAKEALLKITPIEITN